MQLQQPPARAAVAQNAAPTPATLPRASLQPQRPEECAVEAWYMDDSKEDQRLEHR